jgi:hypothetical protein
MTPTALDWTSVLSLELSRGKRNSVVTPLSRHRPAATVRAGARRTAPLADEQTCLEIRALVDATYEAMSTPDRMSAGSSGHHDPGVRAGRTVVRAERGHGLRQPWCLRGASAGPRKRSRSGDVARSPGRRFWDRFATCEAASTNWSRIGRPSVRSRRRRLALALLGRI